ncbi:DUF5316 family protein [Cytobacillus sp. IB215665]|uniref:DUF5316 family protein n=1 Tax=Cytobacillus sp. IB215665 TaxID=3097357 RepID=UPI002A131F35|nr:DUF5316 family protein [Cytobacillus sp. IB215665]MDX8365491.1 DUF5316 family protein [Cytobacillus sp. IB215665]
MGKSFFTGIIFILIIFISSYIYDNLQYVHIYLFLCSAILILLGIIISGFGVSGDRMRANLNSEDKEDKKWRLKWTKNLMITSLPPLAVGIIVYYL